MSSLAVGAQKVIGDVLELTAKTMRGTNTVFCVDFQILHSYLFPSIQAQNSRFHPNVVGYFFRSNRYPLVLPPGAAREMTQYMARHFSGRQNLETLITRYNRFKLSRKDVNALVATYRDLISDRPQINVGTHDIDALVATLAAVLTDFNLGLARFYRLISSGKLVGISDIVPDWSSKHDPALTQDILGKLAARRTMRSRNNENDAINLSLILTLNQEAAVEIRNKGRPRHVFQYLTATDAITNLDLSDIQPHIFSLVDLDLLAMHRQNRASSDSICSIDTAAIVAAYLSQYSNAESAHHNALRDFTEFNQAGSHFLRLDLEARTHSELPLLSSDESINFWKFSDGIAKWYRRIRPSLAADRSLRMHETDNYLSQHLLSRQSSGIRLELSEGDFDAEWTKASEVHDVPIRTIESTFSLNQENHTDSQGTSAFVYYQQHGTHKSPLFSHYYWPDSKRCSVQWPIACEWTALAEYLTAIISHQNLKSECSAFLEYEFPPMFRAPRQFRPAHVKGRYERQIDQAAELSADMFPFDIPHGTWGKNRIYPTKAIIETDGIDIYLDTAVCTDHSQQQCILNYDHNPRNLEIVISVLEKTHPWEWCKPVTNLFSGRLKTPKIAYAHLPSSS